MTVRQLSRQCGLCNRMVIVTLLCADHGQEQVSGPKGRLEGDGISQNLRRLSVAASEVESHAELHIDHRGERFQFACVVELRETVLEICPEAQIRTVPLMRDSVVRLQCKGAPEFALGGLAVPLEECAHEGQNDVG